MEEIKRSVNADHNQPGIQGKKTYIAPTLTRLGTVKQMTQGYPRHPIPDDTLASMGWQEPPWPPWPPP